MKISMVEGKVRSSSSPTLCRSLQLLDRLKSWVGAALPTLIPIFAFLVGMYVGFWAMTAILVFAIAHYAYRKRPVDPRTSEQSRQAEEINRWKQQFTLLVVVAGLMVWRSLLDSTIVDDAEHMCEALVRGDRGDYEDRGRCEGILTRIQRDPTSYY